MYYPKKLEEEFSKCYKYLGMEEPNNVEMWGDNKVGRYITMTGGFIGHLYRCTIYKLNEEETEVIDSKILYNLHEDCDLIFHNFYYESERTLEVLKKISKYLKTIGIHSNPSKNSPILSLIDIDEESRYLISYLKKETIKTISLKYKKENDNKNIVSADIEEFKF